MKTPVPPGFDAAPEPPKPVPVNITVVVTPKPIDDEGWRVCARVECEARFRPDLPTRYFCSGACASLALFARLAMPEPAAPETNGDDEPTPVLPRERVDREGATWEKKYGPMREITKRVSRAKTSARVIFECGHEATVPLLAERGRCKQCRTVKPKRGRPLKSQTRKARRAGKKKKSR
jgi:hypothetical protein